MTELKTLLPSLLLLLFGDYWIAHDIGFYEFKYFATLHFSLWFWCLIIISSYFFIVRNKPTYGGLVISSGLLMKMLSLAVIFYLIHTKIKMNNLQIANFLAMYFLYTFILIYSLSTSLNKNMTKNT